MHLRCLLFAPLLLLLSTTANAQPYTIKGVVKDTLNMNNLHNASITLIQAGDSTLETFTRTKEDGSFVLNVTAPGKYILMSVFPGFADYVDKVEVNENKKTTDLGEIPMVTRTHLLKEFVFTDQFAAIKVKGDTIEYVADSFKVRDNATVEELLKKLPGLQVDKDGNIQAHGQKVDKLLVDGEEFFTDDPAVVSKSLQAKAVDKVQVFDKKSEQAEFTGIDDGESTRTVNLQLKDNMKKGYFGKVVGAGGAGDDQGYFENQLMANYFKGKKKISAFGIMANTGKIGLGWEDRDKFGGSNNNTVFEDGVMYTMSDGDEFDSWSGQYNGRGYPKAWTGGLHFSDKWNEDKQHLAGNYRYAKQNIEAVNNTFSQIILPNNTQQFSDERQDEFKTGQRHRVDGMYEWKTDSLSTLRLTVTGNHQNSQNRSVYNQYNMDANGDTLIDNERLMTNDATTKKLNSSLTWKKKFKKDRRTLMLSLNENYEESESMGFLSSVNISSLNGTDYVDQKKDNDRKALLLNGSAVYTEPITKVMAVSVEYKLGVNNSTSERTTFNKSNPGADAYDVRDSTFSNSYAYNIVTNTGGTTLSWDYKKIDFSAGVSTAHTGFTQRDLLADTVFSYDVVNLFPKAMVRYEISKQTHIRFNYYGNTRQPTIQQIQPLRDNTNPNNQPIGNAGLTQEFRNSFSINANDYKVLSGRWIYLYSNVSLIDNAISQSENVDTLGRRTYQYVNVDGNYSGWAGGGIGKRINKLNTRIGGNFNTSINRTNNFVNGVKNTSNFNRYSVGFDVDYEDKDETIEVGWETDFAYNDNKATISTLATSYWTIENTLDVSLILPKKFEVGTDFNWYIRERTVVFDRNNNVFRWNAYVSKKFLKNDELELRASVFDILNQNLGFSRFANSNQVTETNYNTIRRYGLLTLIWNFTKMAAGAPETNAAQFITK